jgi:exopolysaccharide production protein ExoQ
MLFWLYNKLDAPSRNFDQQSLVASEVEAVQTGADIVARILIVILGMIGIWLLVRYRDRIRVSPWIGFLTFALFCWSALSITWSIDPGLSVRRVVYLFLMLLFSAGCAVRMSPFSLSAFAASIPAAAIVPGVLAELAYGKFRPFSGGYRFMGTAVHPNVEGATLAVAFVIFCWMSWLTRSTLRKVYLASTIYVGVFLVMTGSRTSLIAAVLGIAVSGCLVFARDHRHLAASAVGCLCLAFAGGLAMYAWLSPQSSKPLLASMVERASDSSDTSSLNGRTSLWETLGVYIAERPWRGYGYGSFWTPQHIEDVSQEEGWAIEEAHSAYLDQLLAIGILGVVAYILLLVSCLIQCGIEFWKGRDDYGAWIPVFIFLIVNDLTEGINVAPGFTYLIFLLLTMRLALLRPDRRLYINVRT